MRSFTKILSLVFLTCAMAAGPALSSSAWAQPAPSTPSERPADETGADAVASTSAKALPDADEVRWDPDWYPAQWWEAVSAAFMLTVGSQIVTGFAKEPEDPWVEPTSVDSFVQESISSGDETTVQISGVVADIPAQLLTYYPVIVDSIFVAWYLHDAGEVAINTGVIDMHSIAITSFTSVILRTLTDREQPRFPDDVCDSDPGSVLPCGQRAAESFPSGNTAAAFTGAGLLCVTHDEIPLYGGGFWDDFVCYAGLGAASITGVASLVANDAYLTDVAAGAGLGLASGWLLPRLLHYGFGGDEDESATAASDEVPVRASLQPMYVGGDGAGMRLRVSF